MANTAISKPLIVIDTFKNFSVLDDNQWAFRTSLSMRHSQS